MPSPTFSLFSPGCTTALGLLEEPKPLKSGTLASRACGVEVALSCAFVAFRTLGLFAGVDGLGSTGFDVGVFAFKFKLEGPEVLAGLDTGSAVGLGSDVARLLKRAAGLSGLLAGIGAGSGIGLELEIAGVL